MISDKGETANELPFAINTLKFEGATDWYCHSTNIYTFKYCYLFIHSLNHKELQRVVFIPVKSRKVDLPSTHTLRRHCFYAAMCQNWEWWSAQTSATFTAWWDHFSRTWFPKVSIPKINSPVARGGGFHALRYIVTSGMNGSLHPHLHQWKVFAFAKGNVRKSTSPQRPKLGQ